MPAAGQGNSWNYNSQPPSFDHRPWGRVDDETPRTYLIPGSPPTYWPWLPSVALGSSWSYNSLPTWPCPWWVQPTGTVPISVLHSEAHRTHRICSLGYMAGRNMKVYSGWKKHEGLQNILHFNTACDILFHSKVHSWLVALRIYIAWAIFQPYRNSKQEITNLWNCSGETRNLTPDLLLRKPRA